MIVPSRHRPLVHDPWSESAARAAIEEIAADAIGHFDPGEFWPGHPSGEGEDDGDPSFYKGAAGGLWGAGLFHPARAVGARADFFPGLPGVVQRGPSGRRG